MPLGAGSRLPIAETALGRAWLWTQPAIVQGQWLARLRETGGDVRGSAQAAGIYRAFLDIEQGGACFSIGEWRRDAALAAAPVVLRDNTVAAIGCVHVGDELERARVKGECGAALVKAADALRDTVLQERD